MSLRTATTRTRARALFAAATGGVVLAAGALTSAASATAAPAAAPAATAANFAMAPAPLPPIPLGKSGLPERKVPRTISPGVDITTVFRGDKPARAAAIGSTQYGPWAVRLVVIDPKKTSARLRTTVGADIARTDRVTELARQTRSIVSMNGSFFSLGRSPQAPGDPVGFAMLGGTVISKQTGTVAEANVLIDSATNRLRFGKYTWSAYTQNKNSGAKLSLDDVNTVTGVPAGCGEMADQTQCDARGQVVRFTPQFAARTPAGPGVEVVLNRSGCVARVQSQRGTALTATQTSLQATGRRAGELARTATPGACMLYVERVFDSAGKRVSYDRNTYAVSGRYRLLVDGEIAGGLTGRSISGRNPRSVIGTLPGGKIGMLNIDGRSVNSVGATLTETARVAKALGFRDAVNLDGGGSTVLVAGTTLLNTYSGSSMRAVSDAIVLAPGR